MANTPNKTASKKPKLVRDSFTIPKAEFAVIEDLKTRAIVFGSVVKKSELLRAGLKQLQGLNDSDFQAALAAVPTLKTGRPSSETPETEAVQAAPVVQPRVKKAAKAKPPAEAKKASKAPVQAPTTASEADPVAAPQATPTAAKKPAAKRAAAKASPAVAPEATPGAEADKA